MRVVIFLSALVAMTYVCHQTNANCLINGEELFVGIHYRNCDRIECLKDGDVIGVGCSIYECPSGTEIGVQEADFSKKFPECCERPICELDYDY